MTVVEMESLLSTSIPLFLETPSRIQSDDQSKLTEIAYEMITVTWNFATDFQEFMTSSAARIDIIQRLILENVAGHDTVKTDDMKQ